MEESSFAQKFIYLFQVIFGLAKWLILLIVLLIIVNTFFVAIFIVDGLSMEPNLHDKEFVLWRRNAYIKNNPVRGDIIIMNYPGDPVHKKYVKRVIGMPGEQIDIRYGKIYINKQLLKESYIPSDFQTVPDGRWALEKNQYFVLGDNRPNSNDSRYFGPVEKRFLLGKTLSIIYPRFSIPER